MTSARATARHHSLSRRALPLILLALLLLLIMPGRPAQAETKARLLDEHWLAHNPESRIKVDHADWQSLLDVYLEVADPFDWSLEVIQSQSRANNGHFANFEIHDQREVVGKHFGRKENVNRFDYGAMRPKDKARLEAYLTRLQAVPVSDLNRNEQLAYWINLYNALVVKLVLDHYPVASILDIDLSDEPLRRGPWTARLITVEGRELSLDNIAHNILRPIWHDPRVLYALCLGALGSPELGATAYTGDNAEKLLQAAAVRFINHPRGAVIREINNRGDSLDGDGRLMVSSLYEWYGEDFGQSDGSLIKHLMKYAQPHLADTLIRASEVDSDDFNWKLNDLEQ